MTNDNGSAPFSVLKLKYIWNRIYSIKNNFFVYWNVKKTQSGLLCLLQVATNYKLSKLN